MFSILQRLPMMRAALIVALMTTLVGVSQILLDLVVASKFGVSKDLDAFYLAYVLPSALVNVLAGGAILGAFSPAYIRVMSESGDAAARALVGRAFLLLVAWLVVISLVLAVCYPLLWGFVGPEYAPHAKALAIELFHVLLPFLVLNGSSSLLCATLAARRRFVTSSVAPVLVPVVALAFLLLAWPAMHIHALAAGLVLGASVQCAVLLVILRREQLINFSKAVVQSPQLRSIVGHYAWMLGAAGFLAGISVVDQAMAGGLGAGSVAKLNFGTRLVGMLVAFLTVIIGNAALPYFSRMVIDRDWPTLWRELRKPLAYIFAAGAVTALSLFLSSETLIRLIYERGAFTDSDSVAVGRVQAYYALHIPFYLTGVVGWRMLNALQRNDILIVVAALCFAINVASNYFLVPHMGIDGIALGKALVFGFWSAAILFFLRRTLTNPRRVRDLSKHAELAKQK